MRAIILQNNQVPLFIERVAAICNSFSKYQSIVCMNYHVDPADIVYNHTRRGEGWARSCIHEFTENDYGKERRFHGIEGVASAYKELQEIQLNALALSDCEYYLLDNTHYEESDRENQMIEIFTKLLD